MTRFEPWHISYLLFPCFVLLHLYISPYTKVEESFNIQAAHDILTYGIPTQNVNLRLKAQYDHMEFLGAVPRTFIGALMLAGVAQPILWLRDGLDRQMVVRGVLGAFNALSLTTYAGGVRKAFGKSVAFWFVLFQASQFHVFYYASRTIPNMFAFGMSMSGPSFLLLQVSDGSCQAPLLSDGSFLNQASTMRPELNALGLHCIFSPLQLSSSAPSLAC
jgi:alpha-1,6-mannosyltransferase